jgi:hypothetical protein
MVHVHTVFCKAPYECTQVHIHGSRIPQVPDSAANVRSGMLMMSGARRYAYVDVLAHMPRRPNEGNNDSITVFWDLS